MRSLDRGNIGPNGPRDSLLEQNDGTNNGNSTIHANILTLQKYKPRIFPEVIKVTTMNRFFKKCSGDSFKSHIF
jgi:hypothetical protein